MSNNAPIAFIDSGVGGLPYLQWVKDRLPMENFFYLADSKNFPYGEKTQEEIVELVLQAVEYLNRVGNPKLLVIACNTASVTALESVRKKLDIPVVGVVPAVKPAAEMSQKKRIGVLATERTVNGSYLNGLIQDFASHCHVEKIAGSGIVRFVENNFFLSDLKEKNFIIDKAVTRFQEMDVDAVVLGCTHFIYLSDLLQTRLGKNIQIVDSRDGVGNQIIHIIKEKALQSEVKTEDRFYCTAEICVESYRNFAKMFTLTYSGVIGEL
ncbi:MAG: glutamate racemase [Spirochaetaceae bacterium]|nr:glutamate racemase [Spirochaetaceae bacterium]